MKYKYYEKHIRNAPGRCDVTPLFANPKVFQHLIDDLIKPFKKMKVDKIVGIDALGFIIGGAIAHKLKKGFVPVRKKGKLPGKGFLETSFVDYTRTKKGFEMNKDSIKKRERVLIVDEWIETGAQMKAVIRLIEKQQGKIVGIASLTAHRKPSTEILFKKYNCKPINIKT